MVLKEGDSVPDFCVVNQDGKEVRLGDYSGKWLVVYFYPRDNTPGCSIEGIDFTALKKEFDSLNCSVVGVSADSVECHCKFIAAKNLGIELLSDPEKKMIEAFGVWRPKKFMGREFLGIVRSTFLIDPAGKVACVWDKVRVKGHAQAVLEKARELNKG